MNGKPFFISIEGGDGAGKGTQIKMLTNWLNTQNIKHILTREPGGCAAAETLRSLVVEGEDDRWDGLSEALLYSTARNEHLRQVIRPTLQKGVWVICDRFADSTTVYQGDGRGIARSALLDIHNLVVGETWPDITLILDIDPKVGIERSKTNVHATGELNKETRFENLNIEFHNRVREGFLKIALENPARCKVINADGTPEEVHNRIIQIITTHVESNAV